MARLLFFLAIGAVIFLFLRWLFSQPPRVYWQWIGILLAIGLLLMVVTGRAHWLTAIFAALLPFIRVILNLLGNIPLLKRVLAGMGSVRSSTRPSSGQTSSVQGKYIVMTLDHDSGDLDGEVIEGRFRGRKLSQLNIEELLQLLSECQDDEESVALLQAYLDRVHADEWRGRTNEQAQHQASSKADEMTRGEALQILGLASNAGEAEIIEAHRRLMQKLHPDRGGSAYLAAKINLAKDTLLDR